MPEPKPNPGKLPTAQRATTGRTQPEPHDAAPMTDAQVRAIIEPHQGDGPIHRLYATGEIDDDTIPALGLLAAELADQGRDEEADRIGDVIRYVRDVGSRPPLTRWIYRR
ncbi:hypothetical protein OG601_47175 [Streptomyces sp. NBC_01239]|uniref:hypothetical protein n=1 Tax=Streptomyces sp. NBC_01239 TaxID=2903792 RepID=UPI00225A50DC|nr:hypothetical protein [Streptomyces sp. NBC_01239]MCX4809024.1 hypothetical protein [Streptomyces sp. NBC_01239]MCX4818158.1 hypothetical protein [Streptomyces sp. NBC_01239]